MKKNLISYRIKENLGFVLAVLAICFFSGCGKDDKNVTSVIPPSYYSFGTSNRKYLDATPLNPRARIDPNDSTLNAITWSAPSMTTDLIGYRVYMITRAPQGSGGYENGPEDRDIYDTAANGYSYIYTITSVFSVLDTTYNFYTEIESLPTEPKVIDR